MNKLLLTFIILFSFSINIFSQVDDIKKKSDENKEKEDKEYFSTDEPGNSTDNPATACVSACFTAMLDVAFQIVTDVMVEHHRYIMSTRNENPTVLSIDVMPHFTFSPKFQNINALPRIKGNWGIFSTDFRLNFLADIEDYNFNSYKAIEWQILEFNIIPTEEFVFRFGSGIFNERYSGVDNEGNVYPNSVYNEHLVGLELNLNDHKIQTVLEGRFAFDYAAEQQRVFTEVAFRGSYRFINFKHLFGYITGGIVYQNYYSIIDRMAVKGGLNFNIH